MRLFSLAERDEAQEQFKEAHAQQATKVLQSNEGLKLYLTKWRKN